MTENNDNQEVKDGEVVGAALDLTAQFRIMNANLKAVRVRSNRTRHIAIGVLVGLCLDLLLSVGYVSNAIQNRNDLIGQCEAGNFARSQDYTLWQQQVRIEKLRLKLDSADAASILHKAWLKDRPHACSKIYGFRIAVGPLGLRSKG